MTTKEPNKSDLLLQYLQTARNARCSWGEVEETVRQKFAASDIATVLKQNAHVASLEELYTQMSAAAAEPKTRVADQDQIAVGMRVFAWIGAKQGLIPVQVVADITDNASASHVPRLLSEKVFEVRHLAAPNKGQCVPWNERHLYNRIPSERERASRVSFFERLHEAESISMQRNSDSSPSMLASSETTR